MKASALLAVASALGAPEPRPYREKIPKWMQTPETRARIEAQRAEKQANKERRRKERQRKAAGRKQRR